MSWGLILSALTIVVSMVAKKEGEYERSTDSGTSTSGCASAALSVPSSSSQIQSTVFNNRLFLSGAIFGLGCSLLYNTLSSRFRLSERFRLFWFYLWNTDENKDLTPFRSPTSVHEAAQLLQQQANTDHDDSSVRIIVSPHTTATSTLHVSLLTIAPGRELPSYPARAVEFYYVVSGTGSFSQQGVVETNAIQPGHYFVVDVGHMRWISNRKTNTNDLVLLRATDGGLSYSRLHPADRIRRDPNYKVSASYSLESMLATGLRSVQTKARDYYYNKSARTNNNNNSNNKNNIIGNHTTGAISSLKVKNSAATKSNQNNKVRS